MAATLLALAIAACAIWGAAEGSALRRAPLSVSFLDTGTGSAIFIQAPSGAAVLIDGGPDAGILRSIGPALPWWQRRLDLVIEAHPDQAHATGLIDILQRYRVARLFTSGNQGSGPVMQTLQKTIAGARTRGVLVQALKRGDVVRLGTSTGSGQATAYIEVLFPDRDLSAASASDACLEMKLVYGSTSFMLSCGNASIENYLARLDGTTLHADVLASNDGNATSSELFSGFVGAQFQAQKGETFVSDGQTVSLEN